MLLFLFGVLWAKLRFGTQTKVFPCPTNGELLVLMFMQMPYVPSNTIQNGLCYVLIIRSRFANPVAILSGSNSRPTNHHKNTLVLSSGMRFMKRKHHAFWCAGLKCHIQKGAVPGVRHQHSNPMAVAQSVEKHLCAF